MEPELSELRFVPHPKQVPVINALWLARHICVVTGNQAGKTILGREITRFITGEEGDSTNCSAIIGQDYKAINRNIIVPILTEWGKYVARYDEENHMLILINGHIIYTISAENIKSLEGLTNCILIWIDEASEVPEAAFKAAKVRLMRLRGRLLVTSTALIGQGVVWLEELYKKGINPKYCGDHVDWFHRYMSFTWTSDDNPYLSTEELDELCESLSPAEVSIRRYGKFENMGGRVFDSSYLTPENMGYRRADIENIRLEHYMMVDTASGQKENERGDRTAIVIVGIAGEYGIYGKECISGLLSTDEIQKTIISKCRQYRINKVGVEHIAAQINYLTLILRKAQLLSDAFQVVPLKRIGGDNGKPARHSRLVPWVEAGRIKLPVDEHGNFLNGFDVLIDEMKNTPYGRHDDCIDAMADVANPDMGIISGMPVKDTPKVEKPANVVMDKRTFTAMKAAARGKTNAFAFN